MNPVDSILCNAGELPLELDVKITYLNIYIYQNLSDHISRNILHNPLSDHLLNRCTILENFIIISKNLNFQTQTLNKIQRTSPPWMWSPNINSQLTHHCKHSTDGIVIRKLFSEIMSQQYSNSIIIFIDASKNHNGVWWFAVIVGHENHKFSLTTTTNIYTAENYAIYEAFQIVSPLILTPLRL